MGTAPPPDAPPVDDQIAVEAGASFSPGPTAASICGFAFPPIFKLNFGFKLPPLPSLSLSFNFSIGINCSLDNPFDVSAGVKYGGGRKASGPRDPDDKDAEEYAKKQ